MVTVYVANASLQRHEFSYRLPGQTRERRIPIPSMCQIRVPEDIPDLDTFIEQHLPYGFVSVDELKGLRLASQIRLMYQVGREISSDAIQSLYNINRGFLDEWGRKLREQSAIASNAIVNQALDEERAKSGLEADVSNFEMVVQEQEPKDGFATPDPINEGFKMGTVDPKGEPRRGGKRGR